MRLAKSRRRWASERLVVGSVLRLRELLEALGRRAFSNVADGGVADGRDVVGDALVDDLAALAGADEPEDASTLS